MIKIDNVTVLKNNDEFIDAAIQIIAQCSRYLRIRSAQLDPDLFNNSQINEALSAFARRSRYSEVHILLDYPNRLMQFDHASLGIIRRLSQKVIVKEFYDEPLEERATTIISDNRGVLIKYPDKDKEGFFSLTDAVFTKNFLESFEHEWQQSAIAQQLRSFIL
jgi:hypothetical protein